MHPSFFLFVLLFLQPWETACLSLYLDSVKNKSIQNLQHKSDGIQKSGWKPISLKSVTNFYWLRFQITCLTISSMVGLLETKKNQYDEGLSPQNTIGQNNNRKLMTRLLSFPLNWDDSKGMLSYEHSTVQLLLVCTIFVPGNSLHRLAVFRVSVLLSPEYVIPWHV